MIPALWVDQIASVGLGTSTAKGKLGGTQVSGTAADYTVPGDARSIVAVRPKISLEGLPTANQSVVGTLKIESADLHLGDYEVFANPIDSGLGTAESQYQDAAPWYPCNFACAGGEKVQFFGTPQIANTVQPFMSADVLLADTPGAGCGSVQPFLDAVLDYSRPVQAKIAGINYGGGPTATGTAAASVATDGGLNIAAPQKLLKALYGIVVDSTPAAQKGISGQFAVNAGELVLNPQRWNAEPITGFLGTTTAGSLVHISKAEGLNIRLKSPSFVKSTFTLDTAITTAGNYEVGYLYQDG